MKSLSVIIASCNMLSGLQCCLDNVRRFIPANIREIIIVDNGSSKENVRWLYSQQDVKILANPVNRGLAAAWNQGAAAAKGEHLLFMHNDVLLSPNAFIVMDTLLEEREKLGAVFPWSNRSNYSCLPNVSYEDEEGFFSFAEYIMHEAPRESPFMLLEDICFLMKRKVYDDVGKFDEEFLASGYETYDYSVRMLKKGYGIARSSAYIHHEYGSYEENKWSRAETNEVNKIYFQQKWGFVGEYSMQIRDDVLSLLDLHKKIEAILDIGCSCGGNLMAIREKCPNAELYGVELNPSAAEVAMLFGEVVSKDIEIIDEPAWKEKFDYVIAADVLEHLNNPWQTVSNIHTLLKPDGILVASIPNVQHISNVMNLLHGYWHYEDWGILDRTHLRFFTKHSIIEMFEQAGYSEVKIIAKPNVLSPDQEAYLQLLNNQQALCVDEENMRTFQYLVVAKR